MTSNNINEDGHHEGEDDNCEVKDVEAKNLIVSGKANDALSLCDTLGLDDDQVEFRMFRTFSDPGRKKSLKSLEIPLDNLLSGIIFLSGGRDNQGCPLISLTQPPHQQVDMLIEITVLEIIDMIAYFTSIPNEDGRAKGFVVLLDADIIHDFLIKSMIKALSMIQAEDEPFREVFFISSSRDLAMIDWKVECEDKTIDLPFHQVSDCSELLEFIEKDQLTLEFKGDLSYNHTEWVRFRMQVEPFLCDCISISKRLARTIEPFTNDDIPRTIEQAQQSLERHKLVKRKTLDDLHIDELASEGTRINTQMSRTLTRKLSINPDVNSTVETIQKLLSQIEVVKGRMVSLWTSRNEKLQATLQQRIFENQASQLIEWFEEYAEEFFQTNTELGESLDIAETLVAELKQFETSTQQIIGRVDVIVKSGSELEHNPHTDQQAVHGLMSKIQSFMNDFDRKLSKRRKTLDNSVRLHKLIESALSWSIAGAVILSETNGVDPETAKELFAHFLSTNPPPSKEDLKELTLLCENIETQWIRDTGVFACNRVTEISDRVSYHSQRLEEMVAKNIGQQQSQELVEQTTTNDQVTGDQSPDVAVPSLTASHPKRLARSESLHYDDTGADLALLLLQSLDTATQTAVERMESGSSPSSPTANDCVDLPDDGSNELSLIEMLEEMEKGKEMVTPPNKRHFTKNDISLPSATAGPTFVEEEKMESESSPLPSYLDDQDLSTQTKNAKHRRKLMEELIHTEVNYIRDLEWVVREYIPAMDNIDEVPKNLVGRRNIIFSNITQLLEFNRQIMLPSLEQCSKSPIKLGEMILEFEEYLLNYSAYFKNMPQQTALMEEGGNKFFASVSQRISDPFVLGSYLIKPFQRMARYKLFLTDLIKHTVKSDLTGKLKEYYDKLKEAQKMTDFILRHGNDLLALEWLKGFDGSLEEQGKIIRQGDLTLVERSKHHRRVFLFENTIILSKKTKLRNHGKDVSGSERFIYKCHYKTTDFVLRESIDAHPTRFALTGKKQSLCFQADSMDHKCLWIQDIWDLFFSHMLQLKDKNLEQHGSRPLTSIMTSGLHRTATIGRSFGHSIRHTMTMKYRTSLEFPHQSRPARPSSVTSLASVTSEMSYASSIFTDDSDTLVRSRTASSGTSQKFVDLRQRKQKQNERGVSFASVSTLTSASSGSQSPGLEDTLKADHRLSNLVTDVHQRPEGYSPIPQTSSSSGASQESDCESILFESPI